MTNVELSFASFYPLRFVVCLAFSNPADDMKAHIAGDKIAERIVHDLPVLRDELRFQAGDALSMAIKHVQDPIPKLPAVLKHWQGFLDKALAKARQYGGDQVQAIVSSNL